MKAQKPGLHPRNRHHQRYDLPALCQAHPELQGFITLNPVGEQTIDFANPLAVKALNKALLAHFYAVKHWDIPDGFLCPPVPGRADYIHHLADLLALDTGTIPENASILDIGTGANLIYPLIGAHEYGWRFTGSEISRKRSPARRRSSTQSRPQPPDSSASTERAGLSLAALFIKMSVLMRRCATRRSTIPLPARRRAASVSVAIWGWGGQRDELRRPTAGAVVRRR
jgi:hypothetical protein